MSSTPAVYRFLNVAELVDYMLSYLSRERVDLLTLAAVSKAFRIYALRSWAKHLDIPTSAAAKRLRFFKAHPQLLSQVRFLRIRNDVVEHDYYQMGPAPMLPPPNWDALGSLLTMLHKNMLPHSFPPAIDLTLGHTDIYPLVNAFRHLTTLKERIVAIRIIPVMPPPQDPFRFMGDLVAEDEAMEKKHGDWNVHFYSLYQFIFEVQKAASKRAGTGLRTFHYGHNGLMEDDMETMEHMIPPEFWKFLSDAVAPTLRNFAVRLGVMDRQELILPRLKFDRLEKLFVSGADFGEPDEIDAFLDRHPHIQDLSLDLDDIRKPISLRQTFPDLRWLQVWTPFPTLEKRIDFSRRHPTIRGTQDSSLITQATSKNAKDVYPNLRLLSATYTEPFEKFARDGGRLSHIRLKTGFPPEPLNLVTFSTTSWLARTPEAAKAITCLEIELGFVDINKLRPFFPPSFSSEWLPNLTELSVVWSKHSPRGVPEPSAEAKIGPLVTSCAASRSIRVLRLSDRSKPFPQREILIENVFPVSLEYLVWLEPPRQKPQYFRFVPSPTKDDGSKFIPWNGKRGRLQCIPGIFRENITAEGVWEKPFDATRGITLLDHGSC